MEIKPAISKVNSAKWIWESYQLEKEEREREWIVNPEKWYVIEAG